MGIIKQIQLGMIAIAVCAVVSFSCSKNMLAQSSDQHAELYEAEVLHDGAMVHSGPGTVHYATDQLKRGSVVQVFREDPGGWCAIRPVEGSFSLVQATDLEIIGDGVGQILRDGTQAWVGTRLGPIDKPMAQVKLRKYEYVKLIGQVSWPSDDGPAKTWYQIAPPSGEFRWVRMSDIRLPASRTTVSSVLPQQTQTGLPGNPSQTVRSLHEVVAVPQADFNTAAIAIDGSMRTTENYVQQATLQMEQSAPENRREADLASINRGWRQASRPIGSPIVGKDELGDRFDSSNRFETTSSMNLDTSGKARNGSGFSEQARSLDSFSTESMRIASADRSNLASDLNSARYQAGSNSQSLIQTNGQRLFTGKMSNLELQLTREMIKQDPSTWQLEDLEIAATTIYRTSLDPFERSLAEKFLAKMANCKTIRTGYRDSSAGSIGSGTRSTLPVGLGVNSDIELGTTYDAHGWLTELVRDGGKSRSEYALQDADGKITHHIAPAPGMNLRRYLKSRVGVIGQRGYHSKLKLDHVTAHRVVELEKPTKAFR